MGKIDRNIECVNCGGIFDGGKHYKTKKTCSKECKDVYIKSDKYKQRQKDGMIKTFQEKYGVNSYTETKEFSNKVKKTYSEYTDEKKEEKNKKISTSHLLITDIARSEINKKRGESKKEKYGDENYNNSQQAKETSILKNDGVHHLRLEENIKKSSDMMIEKYGVDRALNSPLIQDKIKTTMNDKYGGDYYFSSDIFLSEKLKTQKEKIERILESNNISINLDEYIKARDKKVSYSYLEFDVTCNKCKNTFKNRLSPYFLNIIGGKICRTCFPVTTNSRIQMFIEDFLQEHGIHYIKNDRTLISPLEIDFYIPEFKIGIEVNGNYWHSEIGGDKNFKYHLNKTKLLNQKDMKLIHIFEDEILFKSEIVKSRLLNIFNLTPNKIYARKTVIKEIGNAEKIAFLEENHLQGNSVDKYRYGLYYEGNLVSVMTFTKLRNALGNKNKKGYELIRFANKLNTNVIGGFSKLLKYFINTGITDYIKTFADVRWSGIQPSKTVYNKNYFQFVEISRPNYWYVFSDYLVRYHRFNYTKQKLKKIYKPENDYTEWEIAKDNNMDRIWDCGTLVFELYI